MGWVPLESHPTTFPRDQFYLSDEFYIQRVKFQSVESESKGGKSRFSMVALEFIGGK